MNVDRFRNHLLMQVIKASRATKAIHTRSKPDTQASLHSLWTLKRWCCVCVLQCYCCATNQARHKVSTRRTILVKEGFPTNESLRYFAWNRNLSVWLVYISDCTLSLSLQYEDARGRPTEAYFDHIGREVPRREKVRILNNCFLHLGQVANQTKTKQSLSRST